MTDEELISKIKNEIDLHYKSGLLDLMQRLNFKPADINKASNIARRICSTNEYIITPDHNPNDVFVIKNPQYKPATFAEKYPYRHAAIIAAIGGIIGAAISIPSTLWERQTEQKKQYQLDSLQNERLQRLSDSLKMLQRH